MWDQQGGTTTCDFFTTGESGWNGTNTSTTVMNLAGRFACNYINACYEAGGSNSSTINLNGVTLQARSDNAGYIQSDGDVNFHVYVNSAGVTFDSDIYSIALNVPLEVGTAGGGLTKIGTGVLTLGPNNTYTGVTNINGGQLNVLTGTPFTGASTNTVNVNTGTALGVVFDAASDVTATATNTNVVFANNARLVPSGNGTTATDLSINDLHAAGQIVVDLAAPRSFAATPTPLTNVEVLHAATVSLAPTSVIPRFADIGAMDVSVAYTSTGSTNGSITLTTVNGAARGWLGSGSDNTWSGIAGGGVNWGDVNGVSYDPAPNGVNARAWFTDSAGPLTNICVLDMNATVNSMLFYGNNSPFSGYDVQKLSPSATEKITLSAIGSSISSETEIQVLGGVNSIEPDVNLASTPLIFVDKNSQLTISGALLQPGATAGLTIVGGALTPGGTDVQGTLVLSSTASNYTGPVSVDNAILSTGRLTPGGITLQNAASLTYSGPTASYSGLILKNGTLTLGVANAGTTLTIPWDTGVNSVASQVTVTGLGTLAITNGVAGADCGTAADYRHDW